MAMFYSVLRTRKRRDMGTYANQNYPATQFYAADPCPSTAASTALPLGHESSKMLYRLGIGVPARAARYFPTWGSFYVVSPSQSRIAPALAVGGEVRLHNSSYTLSLEPPPQPLDRFPFAAQLLRRYRECTALQYPIVAAGEKMPNHSTSLRIVQIFAF